MATSSWITEFLLSTLTGALETIGESKLEEILQQLHDKNVDQYKAALHGGHALVTTLLPFVTKTGTKIDDAIVKALDEAIQNSAAHNGITL